MFCLEEPPIHHYGLDLVIILQDSSLFSLYTLSRIVLSTPTSSRRGEVDLTLWFSVCLSSWFLNHDLELTRLGLLPERYLHHFPATRQASHQSGKKAREVISDQEGTFWINQRSPQLPSTITIPWMRSREKKEPSLTHPPSK